MDGKDIWKNSWPEFKICMKCDEGGNLLVCNENDCLVAVHQECMGCSPRFDEMGRFQCPHCFLKQAVRELQQSWENAVLKKESLSSFEMIGCAPDQGDQEGLDRQIDRVNAINDGKGKKRSDTAVDLSVQSDEEAINLGDSEKLQPCGEADVSRLDKKLKAACGYENKDYHQNGSSQNLIADKQINLGNITACDCDVPASSMPDEEGDSDKRNMVVENQQEHIQTNECNDVQDLPNSPVQEFDNRQVQKKTNMEEGNAQEEDVSKSSRGSTGEDHSAQEGSKGRSEHSSSHEIESESIPVRSSRAKSSYKKVKRQKPIRMNPPRRSSSSLRPIKYFEENDDSFIRVQHIAVGGKRKRLLWSEEEEDMLKEGVHKFSTTVKQNLPWRKILEFGRHVFNETQTPVDLKDKWRNMLAK